MYDDGTHNDSIASDGIYTGEIPGYASGTLVRYYVQAAAANTAKSLSYLPVGAEHDVFIYTVVPNSTTANVPIVINEVMASNATIVMDNAGEYDDWIELYNNGTSAVDLSGFYITDNPLNLAKWEMPAGTIIQPGDYLIIWADEDSSQGPFHANFKLSGIGEAIYLLDTSLALVDSVSWGQQTLDRGYARVPNGTGSFMIQAPTFSANNNTAGFETVEVPTTINLYPNPTSSTVNIQSIDTRRRPIIIRNMLGQIMEEITYNEFITTDVSNYAEGIYLVQCGSTVKKLVVRH
jgi:hypothetical protein